MQVIRAAGFMLCGAGVVAMPAGAQGSAGDPGSLWRVFQAALEKQADTIAALRATIASAASMSLRIDSLAAAQRAAVKQAADAEQRVTQRLAGLGNFRFSGDLRVRYEAQAQAGGFVTRHRERSRVRLGITGSITDELTGGVGMTSGALDDVQSANQTQTGFFSRKTIGFDRFFLSWKPKAGRGFAVVAGKFAYPWERTSLTFGNDINPEGIAPSWTRTGTGVMQRVGVVGFALPMVEVSGGHDSYIAGAQVQSRWKLGARTNARVSVAAIEFHGVDAIAQAVGAGTLKPSSPNTNRVRTDSAGKILGFASDYSYRDVIVAIEHTPSPRLPLSVQLNVVQNAAAAPGERTGLWADVRAGRLSQARDVQVSWMLYRIERDAVLGAFNEQDLRAATNVLNHKFTVSYLWRANATLNAGLWAGTLLDPTATGKLTPSGVRNSCTTAPFTGCRDPWLSRFQLDLSYKF